jgi:hypothetical protein
MLVQSCNETLITRQPTNGQKSSHHSPVTERSCGLDDGNLRSWCAAMTDPSEPVRKKRISLQRPGITITLRHRDLDKHDTSSPRDHKDAATVSRYRPLIQPLRIRHQRNGHRCMAKCKSRGAFHDADSATVREPASVVPHQKSNRTTGSS